MDVYPTDLLNDLKESWTVVVPTPGIKADLLSAYTHWARRTSTCWEEPTICTWDEHLRQIWKRSRDAFRSYRLLPPYEFRYLWIKAGLDVFRAGTDEKDPVRDSSWTTKYVSSISDDAIKTWRLLNDHAIRLKRPLDATSLQGRFYDWISKYRQIARRRKLISDAELARRLAKQLRSAPSSVRHEACTAFLTLPGQGTVRTYYIQEYRKAAEATGDRAKTLDLFHLSSTHRPAANDKAVCAFEFENTNRELQAAASWARERLEKEDEKSKPQAYSFSGSARAEISLKGQGFGAAPEVGSADALGS